MFGIWVWELFWDVLGIYVQGYGRGILSVVAMFGSCSGCAWTFLIRDCWGFSKIEACVGFVSLPQGYALGLPRLCFRIVQGLLRTRPRMLKDVKGSLQD